ncbi:inter-alpha-trypsin inhibitor heavy chain H4 isoform X2 [Erinaceus europaeus]|uniref:Inter-alpha-trypsin inhibitor heavy chain H4 isoform X2 n=1 Tax=Erinaceus europaeus TaxID=9365 RepID=A0ABM3YHE5_ERIEU|nr:inter-alpha-trypsin inhibitor heavy chain H4 isoform X2 [Erinaceus europaeus]
MKTPIPLHAWGIRLTLLWLLAALQASSAQQKGIDIYSLTVDSKVSSRFAHTVVTSRVVNRADSMQEVTFQMELPKNAFITNFSMIIDGVSYPGNIKEKAAAQEQYSAAVARGESAGLVKATGRKMEQFQVSVSVAPAAKVTFELTYEELLKRRLGVYELLLKVRPQQLVKHLQMDIHIFEPQGIRFLDTESSFMTNELAEALTTSQNATKAHIHFKPTLTQQQKSPGRQDTILDGNFIVRYDVNRTTAGGSIQIENGYFVHYFAPDGLPTIPKNVIFVIDKSGSMWGRKIEQTREALIKILDDLNPKDQFNLIVFNREATPWKPSLVPASAEHIKQARTYASGIQAMGGTNINDAVLMGVQMLDKANREETVPASSVSILILLTDGDPTAGETNPERIQKNVQEAISGRYVLFCLGFGFDVSYSFLEKLALSNGGLARRIYEDSDSNLQLQDFYQEVANPLLMSVAFQYPSNAVEEVTQDNFGLLFKGSEMVVAGKLRDQSPDLLSAKISGQLSMQNISFLSESSAAEQELRFQSVKYIFHNFMERLWAYLTIQQLLEQRVAAADAKKAALEARALGLSLNYSFVTPLTSMVVTKPEGQEQSQVAEKPVENENRHKIIMPGQNMLRSQTMGRPMSKPKGAVIGEVNGYPLRVGLRGPPGDPRHFDRDVFLNRLVSGRASLTPDSGLQILPRVRDHPDRDTEATTESSPPPSTPAPLFILPLPGQEMEHLCVDISHSEGPVNLLSDPDQRVEVTGQYDAQKAQFTWLEVQFKDLQLVVLASPEHVVVTQGKRNSEYKWEATLFLDMRSLKMTMDKGGPLLFSSPDKVTIGLLHWNGPGQGLRLLLQDTDRFSSRVGGMLGQFYQNIVWEPPAADDNKWTLSVQGSNHSAIREHRLDYHGGLPGTEISCWSVVL